MVLFASPSGNLTKPSKHFHDIAKLRFRYGCLHTALERLYRLSPLWRGKQGGSGRGDVHQWWNGVKLGDSYYAGTRNNQRTKKHRSKERKKEREKETEETNTQTSKQASKKASKQTSKQSSKQTKKHKQANKQANKQKKNKQTNKQANKQTSKQQELLFFQIHELPRFRRAYLPVRVQTDIAGSFLVASVDVAV